LSGQLVNRNGTTSAFVIAPSKLMRAIIVSVSLGSLMPPYTKLPSE
jgi:hypothetical protein